MNFYKITIQYNGFDYIGWQVQPNGKTIQGTLNQVLEKISKNSDVKTLGSGRTDSGVHALGQVVRIGIHLNIPSAALVKALNSLLPDTIRVIDCVACEESFHPISAAKNKNYSYAFTLKKERNPFLGQLIARYPYKEFDFDTFQKACSLFEGEHDFCNYFCTGTPVNSTVRTIYSCSATRESSQGFFGNFNEELIVVDFVGSGFLKQMVRLMMGTLWSAASGKVSLQDIENSLQKQLGSKLAAVAPAQGLYLRQVEY